MKKHWLFTTLIAVVLCVVCITLFSTEAKAASVDDLTFTLNSDGQSYTVSDCDASASGSLKIPATYCGKPVTSIGSYAFEDCSSLTSITIPDSVTSIGDYAFYFCDRLTSVTIGNGVTSIGDHAFGYCCSVTDVYISNPSAWCNVTFENDFPDLMYYADRLHILDNNGNEATRIILDSTVTAIPDYAFKGCTSLTSVTIPDGVTSIGYEAFYNCDSLTSVTIPDSVTSIGSGAFKYCSSLTSVTIGNGVTSIGYYAFEYCSSLTSVTIPNSLTSIGNSAFRYCSSLTSVAIGNGVTSIGDDAFYYCTSLTSVTIGNGVTSIGYYAFSGCSSLTDVYYAGTERKWEEIEIDSGNTRFDYATIHYNHTHDYSLIPAVTVPATCTEAGYTEYTCAYGEKHRADYVPAGHIKGTKTTVVAPTCEDEGYTQSTCKRCKQTSKTDTVAKLGHKFSGKKTIVAPTCTEDGYTKVQCIRCTKTKKTKYVDAIGHSFTYKSKVAATSTNDGHTKGTVCTECGYLGTATKIRSVKSVKLSATSYVYNGKVQKPTVTVKDSAGKTLKKGTDYDVTYASGRKNAGTYKVTIKFKGNYSGTKTLTFKINPKAAISTQPKTQKVKVGEKIKLTVKATGTGLKYQWQYSTNGKTWKNCSASAAKKASFSFTSKTSHDGNYYRCKVTDSAGNVVYTKAVRAYVLGIEKQPVKKTVTKNKTAKFTVDASGNGLKYQWQYSTDGGKTWKTCSGTAAQKAAFSFKAKISQNGYYFRCKITDSAKNVIYTSKVKLTVKK